ncbi:MAG: DUF1704 domain-containing protein [Candidatus Sacchiramonaceae bacterium]|nr:DUF1704 domain-containing protein [Candidatus Saccharimonadaceae bacterium]
MRQFLPHLKQAKELINLLSMKFMICLRMAESRAARIFRGTPGSDEVSGVFTKDISYFEGLVPGLKYIKNRLGAGDEIDEIMAFASAAKFNLYVEKHQKYVKQKIIGKYAMKSQLLLSAPEENIQ